MGACALPRTRGEGGAAGPTLLADGPGYWVVVGAIVVALVTAEQLWRRNRAWIALVGLGAAATVGAAVLAISGDAPLLVAQADGGARTVATHPGAGVWALALGGVAIVAGGWLLRPRG